MNTAMAASLRGVKATKLDFQHCCSPAAVCSHPAQSLQQSCRAGSAHLHQRFCLAGRESPTGWLPLLLQVYWSQPLSQTSEIKGYWCHGCYQDQKGDTIDMDGSRVSADAAISLAFAGLSVVSACQAACQCSPHRHCIAPSRGLPLRPSRRADAADLLWNAPQGSACEGQQIGARAAPGSSQQLSCCWNFAMTSLLLVWCRSRRLTWRSARMMMSKRRAGCSVTCARPGST